MKKIPFVMNGVPKQKEKSTVKMEITVFSKFGGSTLFPEDLIYKSKTSVVHVLPAYFKSVHEMDSFLNG